MNKALKIKRIKKMISDLEETLANNLVVNETLVDQSYPDKNKKTGKDLSFAIEANNANIKDCEDKIIWWKALLKKESSE